MIRTYPKPEPREPPIYLATELWFAFTMIFGMLLTMAIMGFMIIDQGKLNDCADSKAPQNWIDLCNKLNNSVYTLFGLLGGSFSISLIMYIISKQHEIEAVK